MVHSSQGDCMALEYLGVLSPSKQLFSLSLWQFKWTNLPNLCICWRTTREWTRTRDFPEFKTAKMEDTSFYDLKMKVGFPYLYTHQGDCEHVVILTDVRSALPHFMLIFPRLHTHFFLKLLKMFLKVIVMMFDLFLWC